METRSRTIDLRSDTITRPTPGMREAMARAEVGDDVLGDDPTVIELERRTAELLGKEAAVYVPSGTMGNLSAISALTSPGDEIIAHEGSHFLNYETGGFAAIAGCSARTLRGGRGLFGPDEVRALVRPGSAHFPRTRLLVVENTHNRGGGAVWPLDRVAAVTSEARAHGLRCHLDGARLLNACAAAGVEAREYARHFDTASMCFSKGLGAPVGSAVAGDAETIQRVRTFRKRFGGGMRQAGVVAAAAIYALDHHVRRLLDDHRNAKSFAEGIRRARGVGVNPDEVETNIVFFEVKGPGGSTGFCRALETAGVRTFPEGETRVRAVFHLEIGPEDANEAAERVVRTAASL